MARDGLIVDVRNNGGGSTAHEILGILQRRSFLVRQLGGFEQISETVYRGVGFDGPKALLINEHSFSNAEIFAEGFRELKLGPIVGMPTAGGCIGTGGWTFIDGSSLRTPSMGAFALNGENLEGNGRQPDITIPFLPTDAAAGRDPQLETAVRTLMPMIR